MTLAPKPSRKSYTQCPVLYEDAHIIAIHKLSGVLSHPNVPQGGAEAAFLGAYDTAERCFQTPAGPLWLSHRLDQDASGVLLAAKDKASAKKIRSLFEENKVEKDYIVLLAGIVRPVKGLWRDVVEERRFGGQLRVYVAKSGKPNSELHYQAKETYVQGGEPLTLVQIRLITGRTHQIRVQSSYRGIPVVGDELYGRFTLNRRLKKETQLKRLFLHAFRLAFPHPASGRKLEIIDSLPEDLENFLGKLQRRS